jgi:hypothetical protein
MIKVCLLQDRQWVTPKPTNLPRIGKVYLTPQTHSRRNQQGITCTANS